MEVTERNLLDVKTQMEGELVWDETHQMLYATDASVYKMRPLAVAFPWNVKDLQLLIQFAKDHKTSLIARTAGTSLAGQCVGSGIVVDLSKYFTKILELDIGKRTVRLQPGVNRDTLNEYLKPHGLFFGPNTSTSAYCMLGGMVGNNSSGTTSIRYGVSRDQVLKLETLLSDGSKAVFKDLGQDEFLTKIKQQTLEGAIYR